MNKIKLILEMETADPDDYITLLLLLGHPRIDLKAVVITPGSPDQVGLVKHALKLLDCDVRVGAFRPGYEKSCVSSWHHKAFGKIEPVYDVEDGAGVLSQFLDAETTILTGSPPRNLGKALIKLGTNFRLGRWICQGGFAGEGVVPKELQLPKFAGRTTCPTFNLNGDPKAALALIETLNIERKVFVSKNVCHAVVYNKEFHNRFADFKDKRRSLKLMYDAMDIYLCDHSGGKIFHDPLAAACAIDESIGIWREVEMYREKGEWGARLKPGNTKIIVDYDREKFFRTLVE